MKMVATLEKYMKNGEPSREKEKEAIISTNMWRQKLERQLELAC